ncbi:MFS transporter [Legionella fairfieldensis]|uniref:MFS transporter n=1 Tax=Legionella fairfieldensis TaxID=45064 RepID=UPI00048AE1A0|nr:MFS transporter [Legionella fairfieldensis]
MQKDQRKLLFLSSLGGILEFYDFIIYALFASYISTAFFPATNEIISLLITFSTFAIGYLVRPLGGIIFGHFGDRIGRKATFTVSILMMALATIGLGLVPPYSMIGMSAPILIITLRIIQGFSIGGEIPGAITYVSESMTKHKGLACGVIFCALLAGIVIGFIVQSLVVTIFSEEQMQAYGWRIPFIIGGILGLLSYLLRRELHESAAFRAIEKSVEKFPLLTVCKQQPGIILAGALIIALCAAIVTLLFLFVPAYFTKVLHLPSNAYMWQRTTAITFGSIMCVFFGYMTDFIDVKKIIRVLVLLTLFSAYPIFIIYCYYPILYPLAFTISAFLLGLSAGVIPRLLSELFPANVRYSGIAVSYNLGFAIFGGLTPLISLSLIYYTENTVAPALYLIAVALLTMTSMVFIQGKHHRISNELCNEVN